MKKVPFISSLLMFVILAGLLSPLQAKANSVVDQAEHLITWQMDHGGWSKNKPEMYTRDWNGSEPKSVWESNGEELGTIDNDATVPEILVVAEAYQITGDQRFLDSAYAGIDFLFKLQTDSGGIRQVYPERGSNPSSSVWYSNYVTFNDQAMINALELMEQVVNEEAPFNGDFLSNSLKDDLEDALDRGLDYILESQIVVDGKPTAWCAQHDPVSYEPKPGRAYEHVSISGAESVGIVEWLQDRPNQTTEVKAAINHALDWFEEAKLTDTRYDRQTEPHFFTEPGAETWARFYEIGTNRPIFSGRDGIVRYDIMEVEQERRYGYSWAGSWPQVLLN